VFKVLLFWLFRALVMQTQSSQHSPTSAEPRNKPKPNTTKTNKSKGGHSKAKKPLKTPKTQNINDFGEIILAHKPFY
jgi:hypothetical protein